MDTSPNSKRSFMAKSVAFVLAVVSVAIAQAADDYVHSGASAPALNVPRWIAGRPVSGFEKGQVYAVMIYINSYKPAAEWVGNFASIADKYQGKAHFIAVGLDDGGHQTANNFTESMKGRIANCSLGEDDAFSSFNKTWFRPTALFQTPLVFVIDQNTVVADITGCIGGNSDLKGLDSDVAALLAGNFDYQAAKSSQTAQIQAKNLPFMLRWKEMWPALDDIDRKDYTGAIAVLDKLVADNPEKERELVPLRLTAWLHIDESKAVECAKNLRNPSLGARQLAETPGLKKETYEWAAQALCQAAEQDAEKGPVLYRIAAGVYFRLKDRKSAIEYQMRYLNFCKDKSAPQNIIDAAQKELDGYKENKA